MGGRNTGNFGRRDSRECRNSGRNHREYCPRSQGFVAGRRNQKLSQNECRFGYRDSVFKRGNDIILSAEFFLTKDDPIEIKKRMDERLNFRRNKHPLEYPSAGCVFKNVWTPQLKPRFQEKFRDFIKNDKISAGFLISEAGLKGKKIGGAMVSEKHANFLVNAGGATAEEMIILVSLIKQKVRNNFGALLEEEIQYVGF